MTFINLPVRGRRWIGICLVVAGSAASGCGLLPCADGGAERARATLDELRAASAPPGAAPDAGLERLADWAGLPTFRDQQYTQFSSYNRIPSEDEIRIGGRDFNNFLARAAELGAILLEQVDELLLGDLLPSGRVLAAVDDGPGYVSRMFFTRFDLLEILRGEAAARRTAGRFGDEVLHVFVDDRAAPALVVPIRDLGSVAPLAAPLAGPSSRAMVAYTPISFRKRLRVVLENACPLSGYFYHVGVQRTVVPTRPFTPRLDDDPAYAAARELLAGGAARTAGGGPALETAVDFELAPVAPAVLFDVQEPGTIVLLRLRIDTRDSHTLGALRLRVRYSPAAAPAIDVPIDAFFGLHGAVAGFETLPMSVAVDEGGVDAALYLPMPFAAGARVELASGAAGPVRGRSEIAWRRSVPSTPWGYLHARHFAVAGPQPLLSEYRVIRVQGRGRYVGTFLFAAGRSNPAAGVLAGPLNILEGNETGFIDGEPRLRGTGTEDYFNGGFYFLDGPFDSPFAACNFVVEDRARDYGAASCCRWHILSDALDFRTSFELRFEYGGDAPHIVRSYATVAYYYLDRAEPGPVHGGTVLR